MKPASCRSAAGKYERGGFAAVLLLCAVWFLAGCSPDAAKEKKPAGTDAVAVTVSPVTRIQGERSVPIIGTLYAKDEATVSAEVEGRVQKVWVELGDSIAAGAPLAEIDHDTYEAAARRSAATLARARAALSLAKVNLDRELALESGGVAPKSNLDESGSLHQQALADVAGAEAADAIARLNLEKSSVKAPFGGAVAQRHVAAGDFAIVGAPLYRLVNDRMLKFLFQVPELHAGEVRPGLPVRFRVDAFPAQVFTGRVDLVSPSIDTATRSFSAGALIQNPDRRLKANSYARGDLVLSPEHDILLVPSEAVLIMAGIERVFVMADGKAVSRQVHLGRTLPAGVEVLDGVKEGESVITSGHQRLENGKAVRLRPPVPPAKR